jgi:hypothetical protein
MARHRQGIVGDVADLGEVVLQRFVVELHANALPQGSPRIGRGRDAIKGRC